MLDSLKGMMVSASQHEFTLSHYKNILTQGLDLRFKYSLFSEPYENTRRIYLRHDVDNCIDSALTMANIEMEIGVKSTYLFLLRSENYNVLSKNSIHKIREIHKMGHDVGLHFSLEGQEKWGNTLSVTEFILDDARILFEILGIEIKVFSFHNPTGNDQFKVEVPGLINTYSRRFFHDIKYISESNMVWREKCPCEMFKSNEYHSFQLLVHPMSFCDNLKSDKEVFLYFLYKKAMELKTFNVPQNASLSKDGLEMSEIVEYFTKRIRNSE